MNQELESLNADVIDVAELYIIGKNLRFFMEQKAINSVKLHEALRISTGTVSKIIKGNYNPRILTLYRITSYLGIRLDDLLQLHEGVDYDSMKLSSSR